MTDYWSRERRRNSSFRIIFTRKEISTACKDKFDL